MRPWKELVTDLSRKYKNDVFFSTRTKIIFFHLLSVAIIAVSTAILVEYVQRATLASVVKSFEAAILTGDVSMWAFDEVNRTNTLAQVGVYGVVILVSILVGLVATRLALNPVRESLIIQRRFIASVAHELRTPLAILKTQNEVATLEVEPHSSVHEMLEQNVEEIDHITEILNNLLLFNRVDTLESITFDTVDFEIILETVISRLKKLAEKRGVVITLEQTVIPHVYGNATALEQAFFNIVKNAVNYTPRGGEVVVRCISITEREVTISVSDTGVGIERNELPHIFEPFYRADKVQDMGQGTGLGLAIVFEIVKLHNGRIHVESTPNAGTQFQISIPRQPQGIVASRRQHEVGVAYDFSQKEKTEE